MNFGEYGETVVEGFKSILNAAVQWRNNPLTSQVNRRMWGRWWAATLTLLILATLWIEAALPPFSSLIGLAPPLAALGFIPRVVRELLLSAPALFAFVVVWRVRHLRSSARDGWPSRASVPDFGARFFDAGALPVAVATVVLAIGGYIVGGVFAAPVDLQSPGSGRLAGTVLTVALVAGILSVHRTIGKGLGQLFSAGFFVWGMHMAIGFTVPWMVSWWAYLPIIGRFAPRPSAEWALTLFDLAVACAAWIAAREKCRSGPLWTDLPPPPPPDDN